MHKVTKEADSDKEDAGYGSGADSAVRQTERAVVWFPPLAGGSAQKRGNQSIFDPGLQGDTFIDTSLSKRRRAQVIISEILEDAGLLPELCPPAVSSALHSDPARPVTHSSSVPVPVCEERGSAEGFLLSGRALGQMGELPRPEEPEPAQPGDSEVDRQKADSARGARRRSERLLNRRGVSFLAKPEEEAVQ